MLVLPFPAWAIYRFWTGTGRWEHLGFLLLAPTLAFATRRTNRLFVGLYPFCLVGLVYDSMYLFRDLGLTKERVHVCDLRALDLCLFGIPWHGGKISVHDWLQSHSRIALDLLCAIPYGTFIFVSIAFAVFLYVRDEAAMRRFGWTFLIVNLLGFVTYHLYPAAPPWYFHAHGCVVDLAAHASEGPNLARVDARLGFPYFAAFYGRSNDVFGAVPSLHVTYPLMVARYGYRYFGPALRSGTIAYFLLMCFAAVYLDHHWILDVVLGVLYALATDAAQSRIRHWTWGLRRPESLFRERPD